MWRGPGQDPGGGSESDPPPAASQELSDLKDQFEQQQVLIAQLKEMIRKNEQSSVTQEKVEEYMNTLTKMNARAKKGKSGGKLSLDTSGNEKVNLLRQQMEENRLKLAERGKNQKGIEEMVTQLKAQLDDSQQMINQSSLGASQIEDMKIEYGPQNSSEELYHILLSKERHVSELLEKVHKLESNVLDLQENLKEKDSVIDARTKAITLMSENLSKKGKNTLDQLDETKEQMRKMQENFIVLEGEMKARQSKLLDDLKAKNYEIAELQESLEKSKTADKEEGMMEYKIEIDKLQRENRELKKGEGGDKEEIEKLKKQLDESNKSMIKVKAQHKSKVKELTKKIDGFKKVSDANAKIVQLEAENCKLSQKVAELEEEKGSLQLKFVETDSNRGSEPTELEKELETKLLALTASLEEKDRSVASLENEIVLSKSEIEILNEKLKALTHIQNAQVTSEIESIHFEEQLDVLEIEKKKLLAERDDRDKEKEDLLEQIEGLKKEKHELSQKLESYIQENMELVDKLEKLSAEKVSSAESIEIVEGLTQQEKLELEAYQKSLEVGMLKSSEENLPQNVDLNESVNELTEETSELLQRIELFTVERREVMEKMEQLKMENNNLSLKIKEVENNRDVLAETYEKLQTEKEVLDVKLEKMEKERENEGQSRIKEYVAELEGDIDEYKTTIEVNKKQIEKLNGDLKELEEKLQEQIKANVQISDALMERAKENETLGRSVEQMNDVMTSLEDECTKLHGQILDLEKDKASLNKLIEKNQEEFEAVSNTEWEHQRLLESKDDEINKLIKERNNLEEAIKEKDANFHRVSADLKEKYLELQAKLESNAGSFEDVKAPLETKIEELTNKNKVQLDKMKKIAANLKKKISAYNELEESFKSSKEKWEVEVSEKEAKISNLLEQVQELEGEVSHLSDQVERKSLEHSRLSDEFEGFKREKVEELTASEAKNVELQNVIVELRVKVEKASEVSLQQELMLTQENFKVEGSLQAKIQELEMIIETQDAELTKYKERVNKLEEGIAFIEERRMSLEKRASELGAQLEERSANCEELSKSGDMLEERLVALSAQDELIERKLEETVMEKQDLLEQNKKLHDKNEKLKKKAQQAIEKLKIMENYESTIEDLEQQNSNLKKQIHELEVARVEIERQLGENKLELERLSGDWQAQFDEVSKEKAELSVACEKLQEELKEVNEQLSDCMEKLQAREEEIAQNDEEMRKIIEERSADLEKAQLIQELEDVKKEKQRLTEELGKVMYDLQVAKGNLNVSIKESEVLKKQLEDAEAVKVTAEDTVSSIINQAEEHLTPSSEVPKEIPTFVWGDTPNDPFDFIKAPEVAEEPKVFEFDSFVQQIPPQNLQSGEPQTELENSQEELLKKVKTLEFMLYSVEKEKEEAVLHCNELSNELTRLVYERQQTLEAQIVPADVINKPDEQLQQLEFTPVNPSVVSSEEAGAVVEEVIRPKEAYLCFAGGDLESQIETDVALATRDELQSIEFEPTRDASAGSTEETVLAKTAYVCEGKRDTFGENDDGWGWGPEETRLEEEHHSSTAQLEEKVRVLELEREHHLEEIKQLQIKSGKLIKKLKEFKAKNEQLTKKTDNDDFFNLDNAIQEELKLQIEQVERKLRETSAELEREKVDKATIQRRIEALTATNERMVEQKEKQDVELLSWQQSCRDLSVKLERFEWGDDGFVEPPTPSEKRTPDASPTKETLAEMTAKIKELNETLKDLTLDNEELQALLEEQRNLRLTAEKARSVEPILENVKTEAEYLEVVNEKNTLIGSLELTSKEKKLLQDQVNELIKKNDEILSKFALIESQKDELTALVASKDAMIDQLNFALLGMEAQKALVENSIQKEAIETKIDRVDYDHQIESLTLERDQMLKELQEKDIQIESLKTTMEAEINLLRSQLAESEKELKEVILEKDAKMVAEIERISLEWAQRVDQRGDDVAESWKTHMSGMESDHKELEAHYQKEIEALEAKCNVLVNENNELRKNVDAEIRNEVDKYSALQQQINDRQMYINDLSRALQEKQDELELVEQDSVQMQRNFERTQESLARAHENLGEIKQDLKSKNATLARLQQEAEEAHVRYDLVQKQLEVESRTLNSMIELLSGHSNETVSYETVLSSLTTQLEKLREKEHEVALLKQQLTELSSDKRSDTLLEEFRVKLEENHKANSDLCRSIDEKDQTIASLSEQLRQIQALKEYENENTENLQQNLVEYQQLNTSIDAQLREKNARFEELANVHQNCQHIIQERESEVGNLRSLIEEREREHVYAIENLQLEARASTNDLQQELDVLKKRLNETENHYEEVIHLKDTDIESLKLKMQELLSLHDNHDQKVREVGELSLRLNERVEECTRLEDGIRQQAVLIEDHDRQMDELRSIIEDQVIKIEDLKKNLFEKSNDYDSLIAEVDISRTSQPAERPEIDQSKVEGAVGGDSSVVQRDDDDDLSEPVSRAELDLALYMLHQRDVRCEELTVELTQLLEERDTLQLRLSNAIREKEEISGRFRVASADTSSSSTGAVSKTESAMDYAETSSAEAVSLANKLTELRQMGYKKDKTLVDQQELRRLQELSIMQQHMDVASKLPPEAAARLVDASYTLSRDVQSPSKVLLNWLWGRSTPKVNNI